MRGVARLFTASRGVLARGSSSSSSSTAWHSGAGWRRSLSAAASGAEKAAADTEEQQQQKKEEKVEAQPEDTEVIAGPMEKRGFQAETLKLLDIVTHSLYSNKEVFIRELISNASDALEKARQLQATGQQRADRAMEPLEIRIYADEKKGQLVIQDFGVGMKREELVENLGTIAHSGTQAFMENMQKSGQKDVASIIGQFGVGFYSVFMVADRVTVYTRSHEEGAKGYVWMSDGSGEFEVAEADGVAQGTKIVIHLKKDCRQFASSFAVQNVIKKYSNFVGFPILVNGERVNTIAPLWTQSRTSVTKEQHEEFYRFIAKAHDKPLYSLMYQVDAPLNIRSALYVGETHVEKFGMQKMDPGVSLFSRKILITPKAEGLLPEWLRFVQGVVDSEDVPLSVSREHLQDQLIIQKLGNVMTKRVLKMFKDEMKKDPEKYDKFFTEFGTFLKQGLVTDQRYKDDLAALLRVETTAEKAGKWVSLDSYVERMKPKQQEIYYLHAPSRALGESSPYYELFKKKGIEVILVYSMTDEVVLQNVMEYKGKRVMSIESDHVDLSALGEDEAAKDETQDNEQREKLPQGELDALSAWLKEKALSGRVAEVVASERLVDTPVLIADFEGAQMRRMMKFMDPNGSKDMALPAQKLQINPSHPLIKKLAKLKDSEPEVAQLSAEQLFDNALVTAGLLDDSREMLPRINKLLERVLDKYQ